MLFLALVQLVDEVFQRRLPWGGLGLAAVGVGLVWLGSHRRRAQAANAAVTPKRGLWLLKDRLVLVDHQGLSVIPKDRFLGPKYAGRSREGVGALLLRYEDDGERHLRIPDEPRSEWFQALEDWAEPLH